MSEQEVGWEDYNSAGDRLYLIIKKIEEKISAIFNIVEKRHGGNHSV